VVAGLPDWVEIFPARRRQCTCLNVAHGGPTEAIATTSRLKMALREKTWGTISLKSEGFDRIES
jgi:hypothetical protein